MYLIYKIAVYRYDDRLTYNFFFYFRTAVIDNAILTRALVLLRY